MKRKGKWIEVESPDEPVEQVAAHALEARLDRVGRQLQLAAKNAKEDVEHVHQLRVATRRAVATMEIFAGLLPPKRSLWIDKQLRRVRKAAGDARDLDVLAMRVNELVEREPESPWEPLAEKIAAKRRKAQGPIEDIYDRLHGKDFSEKQREFLERIRLRTNIDKLSRPTFACAARKAMRPLVDDFFIASEGDFSDYRALHAFRIESKQLRYAMEIFAGAFDRSFRTGLYPLVEQLQEKLGEINDHATAKAMFDAWTKESPEPDLAEALAAMSEREVKAMDTSRRAFFDWWTTDRKDELRRRFAKRLSLDDCMSSNGQSESLARPKQVPANQADGK